MTVMETEMTSQLLTILQDLGSNFNYFWLNNVVT